MKSFLDHLKEEVLPSVQVADGGLDISKPAVRAAINAAIAGVISQPSVTPYVVFNRLSKLLAQYHIILPKRFLEGDKGVEVFEVRQFGHKMGMTDSGEFVNEVPSTHYLFLQYGIITPFGVTYAKPVVGGMFKVMARLVDKIELDKLMDMAEITMAEEAECMQAIAKANAPKEEMHDITSDEKKKGNKEAVADSEKGLKEDKDPCWKGYEMIGMKKKGARKVPNCVPVKEEEQIDELSNYTMSNYMLSATDDLRKLDKKGKDKDLNDWKKINRREHGMHRAANKIITREKKLRKALGEEQIDELKRSTLASYIKKAHVSGLEAASQGEIAYANKDKAGLRAANKTGEKREQGIERAASKLAKEETQIDEVSKRAAISAYREKEAQERDTGKLHGLIKRKFGAATAKHAERAGAADTGNLVHRGKSHGVDRLASAKSSSEMRKSKEGKIHKQDVASKKSEIKFRKSMSKFDKPRGHLPEETIAEKAPPGAKFERMVKHIKKGYGKDGLTAKEKSIAYATAWKAKNREKGE